MNGPTPGCPATMSPGDGRQHARIVCAFRATSLPPRDRPSRERARRALALMRSVSARSALRSISRTPSSRRCRARALRGAAVVLHRRGATLHGLACSRLALRAPGARLTPGFARAWGPEHSLGRLCRPRLPRQDAVARTDTIFSTFERRKIPIRLDLRYLGRTLRTTDLSGPTRAQSPK
jgi:hypothetical protein